MCMSMCERRMYVCAHNVEARDGYWVLSLIALSPDILRQGFLLNPELTGSAIVAGQQSSGIPLSLLHQGWDNTHAIVPAFYVGIADLNLTSQVGAVSTWPTEDGAITSAPENNSD